MTDSEDLRQKLSLKTHEDHLAYLRYNHVNLRADYTPTELREVIICHMLGERYEPLPIEHMGIKRMLIKVGKLDIPQMHPFEVIRWMERLYYRNNDYRLIWKQQSIISDNLGNVKPVISTMSEKQYEAIEILYQHYEKEHKEDP